MAVTDLRAALDTLKQALPALEKLAVADEVQTARQVEAAQLVGEVARLESQRDALKGQVTQDTKASQAALDKVAKEHAATINLYEEKVADLQRSQQTAENQLAATRAENVRLRAQYAEEYAKDEAAHKARVQAILIAQNQAEATLTLIQNKLKAIHGDMAGMVKA